MSWGEVKKITEKIDLMSMHRDIFVGNATYTVPISGRYRIIAIGKGADGYYSSNSDYSGGGAGGIGVIEINLVKGNTYAVTVATNASFGDLVTATGGTKAKGGSASGTDVVVYPGGDGSKVSGGSVSWTMGNLSSGGNSPGHSDYTGGRGAFGGNGGDGASGVGFQVSSYYHVLFPAQSGAFGGGAGGAAEVGSYSQVYTGAGGGGGFGGGGGACPPSSRLAGKGGAAAVIIQYLGF